MSMHPHRRPPSSASVRQGSASPFVRPSSSASTRPPSSASVRPSSSASSVSRLSAASRAESRATQRPGSRVSFRPNTRQSSRLNPLYQSLVTQLTGLTPEGDEDGFQGAVDHVVRALDQTMRPTGSVDPSVVEKQLLGHIQKARIKSQDSFADALQTAHLRYKTLASRETDLDAEILASKLPTHLHFLLTLSQPPDTTALHYAEEYIDLVRNPGKARTGLTWSDILSEEPFEGQHWEGAYGLPPGAIRDDDDSASEDLDSLPSLSPWDDDPEDLEERLSAWDTSSDVDAHPPTPPTQDPMLGAMTDRFSRQIALYSHRDEVEGLQALQYWRSDWRENVRTDRAFDIGDPSTFGPAFQRATDSGSLVRKNKHIPEHDAVREILMGLQGRRNILITWLNGGDDPWKFVPDSKVPSLMHLTPLALQSMLLSFSRTATYVEHLRRFVSAMFKQASKSDNKPAQTLSFTVTRRNTRTFEAFAEATDKLIRAFDRWCAGKEEEICMARAGLGPPRIISLLDLEKSLREAFSEIFKVLLELLQNVVRRATQSSDSGLGVWAFADLPKRMPPAAMTALLLDSLLQKIQDYSSMGDAVTSDGLLKIFSDAAEPLWGMVHRWLKDGLPIRDVMAVGDAPDYAQLNEEFFIEDNELVLLDPDFWSDGFALKSSTDDIGRAPSVPMFLQHAAPLILAAGKAIGLLHALGMPLLEQGPGAKWLSGWKSFGALLHSAQMERSVNGGLTSRMSSDDFSRLVYEELLGPCTFAKQTLSQVLVDECDLWTHLTAVEELYLMRRGDVMSNFLDVLFARMDISQSWSDFHFLNTAFGDVVSHTTWLDPTLVRVSHRGSKDKTSSRTARAVEGLFIEYAVPFPLTYIWGPRAMQVYSTVFVFLLQIRRAKNVLERILVRRSQHSHLDGEMKMFYAMRGKLSWFVNVLLNFICTNVLHVQVLSLHDEMRKAMSLDEILRLHDEHLSKLETRCLLRSHTTQLHRAIISILDMALHFSDCFIAYRGSDATHDVSHQSITPLKAHRSRRLQRQKRNVIGFTQERPLPAVESSDSDTDTDDESVPNVFEADYSLAEPNVSFAEENIVIRLDKMSRELDALVRFIRRGVEALAGGTRSGEAAAVFDVFAFALEDWDQ